MALKNLKSFYIAKNLASFANNLSLEMLKCWQQQKLLRKRLFKQTSGLFKVEGFKIFKVLVILIKT